MDNIHKKESFLSAERYKAKSPLNPKKEETKQYYIALYKDYLTGEWTMQEIATRHGISVGACREMIKWAAQHLNAGVSREDFKNDMLYQVEEVERRLTRFLDGKERIQPKKIKDIVMLLREIRLNKRLSAQLKGVLSTAAVDNSDRRKITVVTNDLGRRRGGSGAAGGSGALQVEQQGEVKVIQDAVESMDMDDPHGIKKAKGTWERREHKQEDGEK